MTGIERRLTRLETAAGVGMVLPGIFVRFVAPGGGKRPATRLRSNGKLWRRDPGDPLPQGEGEDLGVLIRPSACGAAAAVCLGCRRLAVEACHRFRDLLWVRLLHHAPGKPGIVAGDAFRSRVAAEARPGCGVVALLNWPSGLASYGGVSSGPVRPRPAMRRGNAKGNERILRL